LTGFFIIKPSHPDGLKKTDLGEKNSEMGALIMTEIPEAVTTGCFMVMVCYFI